MSSIFTILSTDPAVLLITSQIFREEVDQGTQPPFVQVTFISGNPENGFDGVLDGQKTRYAIHCYGSDEQESNALFQASFNALKTVTNIFNINSNSAKDPSGEAYLSQFDVSVWT